MSLKNKVAIITGSSSGIGAAIAKEFAHLGANVIINSVKSVNQGQELAASLANAFYMQADVSDEVACNLLIKKTIEHWGQLDMVINNASATIKRIPHDDFEAATDDLFRSNFDVNVMGSWYMSRAAFPHLAKAEDGVIVNLSSIAALRPMGASIPYAVSKAAVTHLTHLLAKAMAPKVRVNAVAPGLIETPRTAELAESVREKMLSHTAMHQAGQPEDIAQAVLGIVNCKNMTGSVVVADGGYVF